MPGPWLCALQVALYRRCLRLSGSATTVTPVVIAAAVTTVVIAVMIATVVTTIMIVTVVASIVAWSTSANVSASTNETMPSPAVVIAPVVPGADP